MKSRYSKISGMDELDAALKALSAETSMRVEKAKSDYSHVKSFYTPANLFNYAVDRISPVFNLAGLAIEAYDRFRLKVDEFRRHSAELEKND